MAIYVINPFQSSTPHFPIIGMIETYESMIWNPQLYARGAFQLVIPATDDNVNIVKDGRMLVRECDIVQSSGTTYKNAMIIRRVAITYDADKGYMMVVSGKSVKDILSQRIIWDQYTCKNKSLPSAINDMLQRNIIDPLAWVTSHLSDLQDIQDDLQEQMDQAQSDYLDAKADYNQAVADYGADSPEAATAKAVMDAIYERIQGIAAQMGENTKKITYYEWSQACQENRQIPYIYSGVTNPPASPPTITAELRGENLGDWVEAVCMENRLGWDMVLTDNLITFTFVVGTDRHTTVIFSPEFDNLKSSEYVKSTEGYMNAGIVLGEGEGFSQQCGEVGTAAGYARYEDIINTDISRETESGEINVNDYIDMMIQYGKSELITRMNKETFSGELDTDGMFKIGEDFNMGDKVSVQNEVGISATTRLIEIIYSDEASGYKTTGIFEEWEV